uniref:Death domain-containing protein n=1 Tax=Papio anubis TaxID=9555 RepID=A0A8I5NU10_PAPAN
MWPSSAGAHIDKDSSWPKLELQSWEVSTRTRCMGIAVSSWTLLAVWSPMPPTRVSPFPRTASPPSPCVVLISPASGPHPELGCQLYLDLPRQHQEKVERLLEVSVETDKGWRGLADHLGYQAEAVEIMAQGQVRAYTLLRDWAIQEGSGATHKVLENALVAMGQEDVVQVLGPQAEGCSVA